MASPAAGVEDVNVDSASREVDYKLVAPAGQEKKRLFARLTGRRGGRLANDNEENAKIKLSITDVNPLPPMWAVLKQPNNLLAVFCSGADLTVGRERDKLRLTRLVCPQVCCLRRSTP
jgi:hypothetical protein